tara:strand:+ start:211 stop:2565 length:2355 start_codon:yes stop_codon:yes gene_type:complete
MSLPPGYLAEAGRQAAGLQRGIAGVGADIGDVLAGYGKSVAEAEARQGAMTRLEARALAAIEGGALADPTSEGSVLMRDIKDYGNKNAKQQKIIYADTVAFIDRHENERDLVQKRYATELGIGKLEADANARQRADALRIAQDALDWDAASAWVDSQEAAATAAAEAEGLSQRQQDTGRAIKGLSEVPAVRRAGEMVKGAGQDILERLGLREAEYSVDDYLGDYDRAQARKDKTEADFNQEMMETWVVPHQQRESIKAAMSLAEDPAVRQAVRDAAGSVRETGAGLWEGIKDLLPQQAPPERMLPNWLNFDDEQKARIEEFLKKYKEDEPVDPSGLPQGSVPDAPTDIQGVLKAMDERIGKLRESPAPSLPGSPTKDDGLQYKWDDPPTPAEIRNADKILGLAPLEPGEGETTGEGRGGLKPHHDFYNPEAYKTNPSFQRKAKREGWTDAQQIEEWEKRKAVYTRNDPEPIQQDIDKDDAERQKTLDLLKGLIPQQQRLHDLVTGPRQGAPSLPPQIPAPKSEPAWLKPYRQQMRYLASKGHKNTKALRDAVRTAAMERFPEGLKEVDTGHAFVVLNDGKVVFQVKKDMPKQVPVGEPMIFSMPNGRQGFRQPDGKVEFIPEITNKGTKPTADQSNAYMYGMRMRSNAKAIDKLFAEGKYDPTGLIERVRANVKWDIAEIAKTEEDKEFLSASQNWIAAVLRKESGARIDPDEYSDAAYQYFPAVGDSDGTVKRKAQLRKLVEEVMLDVAGGMTLEEVREQTEEAAPGGGIRVRRFNIQGNPRR